MKSKRIFIEKKTLFDSESSNVFNELSAINKHITSVKIYLVYDLFSTDDINFTDSFKTIFVNPVSDILHENLSINQPYFAVEYLPGQYDQRGDSAEQCLQSIGIENITVKSGKIYVFENCSETDLLQLKKYIINPIESREKDLTKVDLQTDVYVKPVPVVAHFIDFSTEELHSFYKNFTISLPLDDLEFIQKYFKSINRNPTETELRVLDTYWSDHCRHTTFETELTSFSFPTHLKNTIEKTFQKYLEIRETLHIKKPIRLMDMATIMAKYLKHTNILTNLDESEEINACSVVIPVDNDGKIEDWLLQFKNETHNHPTEIEPYGGASTCIGGAIRDPLSGRAYVYQAMRVTGSANPLEKIEDTRKGKLPQRKITTEAARGYSSYGNQIGLATTLVKEFYNEGFKAKRMEVGFVMGAVKKDWVIRQEPKAGDVILVLGGATGRDGIGGATGSSKVQDNQNLDDLSAEVQKGNATIERKIQRLFRQEKVTKLIKKCNDFGAGGVSVAIGEISRGVSINLNQLTTKYKGLNGTELAIAESQERMAVVVDCQDVERFIAYAKEENLEAVAVAKVTDNERLQIFWNNQPIVDIERSFLDTNGVSKQAKIEVTDADISNLFADNQSFTKEYFLNQLKNLNHCSQKGLIQQFDCNVGCSTVLAPLGGRFQDTPEDVSVQKIPTFGKTTTVSMATFGYQPEIAEKSPYYGAYFSVIDSIAKIVAAGGNYSDIYLTFQEYFERLKDDPKRWGKPFAALLGTIEAQKQFSLAAIGGKDSMSGSFEELDVPPTLISFAVCPNKNTNIKASTLPNGSFKIYRVYVPLQEDNFLIDSEIAKKIYTFIHQNNAKIRAMKAFTKGGLAETLSLMAFGNEVGFDCQTEISLHKYFPGSLVFVSNDAFFDTIPLDLTSYIFEIGKTNDSNLLKFNDIEISFNEAKNTWNEPLETVFPTKVPLLKTINEIEIHTEFTNKNTLKPLEYTDNPMVVMPVFPGSNSEYDSQKAFENEGATVVPVLIKNQFSEWLNESIETFVKELKKAHILFIPGGFSAADEPDGSGKFIASILKNREVKEAVHELLERNGLILGICNGFQALVQAGLLPYGKITELTENSPILYHNSLHKHIAKMVKIKVTNDSSPWLNGLKDKTYWMPISHGEGRWMAAEETNNLLIKNNQIATQYVDFEGNISFENEHNPNGSMLAIEGIISPCGKIFGRMGHPERVDIDLFINIPEVEKMPIFKNAVNYFRKNS